MKRDFTLSGPDQNTFDDIRLVKRLKADNFNKSPDNATHTHDHSSARTTPHPDKDPQIVDGGTTKSILQWMKQCGSCDKIEMPQTPISTTPLGTRRRTIKQFQRRRSQSPVKNVSGVQYRAMNMADANVFVDHYPEAPSEVESQIRHVFGDSLWSTAEQHLLNELVEQYCIECRVLAKRCAGENEWRSNLFLGLLQQLTRLGTEVFMLSASEKPWLTMLKPTAPSSSELILSDVAHISSTLQQTRPHISVLPNTPIFSAPSTTASDVSSSSENPNGLLTPKPDVALGLAHTSFTPVQRRVLRLLQDDGRVLSEPHQAQIGLQFPFLIVETKGGSAGGNMIGAQNQAAVDGACIMNILGDLQNVVKHIASASDRTQNAGDGGTLGEKSSLPAIAFSITTEGPLHEIWVHYQVEDTYHMTCYRAWRTTRREDAREFVYSVAKIVGWARKDFRESLLSLIERIERPVLAGVLNTLEEEE